MAFFQRNQSPMLPNQPPRQQEPREKKPMTKEDKKLLWLVIGCSVASTLLYFGIYAVTEPLYTALLAFMQQETASAIAGAIGIGSMVAYAVAGTAFLATFIIYNRAFTRDNITHDMLPDSMSEQEKEAFIQDGIQRKRKSKWMIIVIIALFCPLAIDFLIMTAIPTLLGPIFGQYLGA